MEKINYINLLEIQDKCIMYSNDILALVVEIVNNSHLFIEIEEINEHTDKKYKDVEGMKNDLIELKLDVDYSNYFVRKAEIVFNEKYR